MSQDIPRGSENPPSEASSQVNTGPTPKEWHATLDNDLRIHMIKKM